MYTYWFVSTKSFDFRYSLIYPKVSFSNRFWTICMKYCRLNQKIFADRKFADFDVGSNSQVGSEFTICELEPTTKSANF